MSKALFLLKLREDYNDDPSYSVPSYSSSSGEYSAPYHLATGMYNSAKFVVDTLNSNDYQAGLGLIVDGNSVDRAVMAYDPTHVIVEGLWVTPAKFAELMALRRHAGRTWVVRIHSEIPFLSSEGVAMRWIGEYMKLGVIVAPNGVRATEQIAYEGARGDSSSDKAIYLPNCYPVDEFMPPVLQSSTMAVNIGCFGAFRPLKNQLQQAFAALKFADWLGRPLRFHINGRIDAGGQGAINNVLGLFAQLDATTAEVVNHDWENRETFIETLREIDMLMQVSMSETFNIVAADAVLAGIPVIATDELPWYYPTNVDPQSVDNIVETMKTIWLYRSFFLTKNRIGLQRYNRTATRKWLDFLS
jgi:glycosyltransferase involved in cell wall biosynthesis